MPPSSALLRLMPGQMRRVLWLVLFLSNSKEMLAQARKKKPGEEGPDPRVGLGVGCVGGGFLLCQLRGCGAGFESPPPG